MKWFPGLSLLLAGLVWAGPARGAGRAVINLNGEWDIAEGTMAEAPARFASRAPVPGLADMAQPPFAEVGTSKSPAHRQAFWYRRAFPLDQAIPEIALLKVHKAAYGSRVYVNGELLGEHPASFTPGYFDARRALRGNGATNVVLIRVGAWRDAAPPQVPYGGDFEKIRYLPGLFDAVELILSGTPNIVHVQAAPDLSNQAVRVQALLENIPPDRKVAVTVTVREAQSRQVAGTTVETGPGKSFSADWKLDTVVPIKPCRLWSPAEPFLYELEVSTGADTFRTRFGMRTFRFDPQTGRALLNGRPYFPRGSNVTLYRFFEDPERGDRPWRTEWVRRLHRRFKEMHWDMLRYCIGFPPEFWYDIADEEGIMIQDEFPLWGLGEAKQAPDWAELSKEYAEWMRERWNHPCVIIWDAQNETRTEVTGQAIQAVRQLDLSNRPWDNGWGAPQEPGDCYESHPYLFSNPAFQLENLARVSGRPGGNPAPNRHTNAIVLNEYGWLWLNRDGTPTTLTRDVYRNLLGDDATPAARQYLYARYLAALTEFWRGHRACAAVLHFCGLGYSRPGGQTSDHFTNLETLAFEPNFFQFVRDAFAPVGVMIGEWAAELPAGRDHTVPVKVINDLFEPWTGPVRFRLLSGRQVLHEEQASARLAPLGEQPFQFSLRLPAMPGQYQFEAALGPAGSPRSLRDFAVLSAEEIRQRNGLAVGCPVKASSVATRDGVTYRAAWAADGDRTTRWSSEFSDPQWLEVDLGEAREISRVELLWEAAYGRAYAIQVSNDGAEWKEVYATKKGRGGVEKIRFPATTARYVRFHGAERATPYGYSLWELRVLR